MDILSMLSSITGGMEKFGEAGQYAALSTALKAQAGLYDISAQETIVAGDQEANKIRIAGDKIVARQKSYFAKAGVKFIGSPASVYAETERNVQLDVVNTKLNYAERANALGFQGLQQRIAAGQAKTRAWQRATQGLLQIAGGMAMSTGGKDMGGGGVSDKGNVYGSNTPKGVRDMGTYSRLPRR